MKLTRIDLTRLPSGDRFCLAGSLESLMAGNFPVLETDTAL